MIWFCDTSALLKRYLHEIGSKWFRFQISQHRLVASAITVVEMPSAMARRHRQGSIPIFEMYRGRVQFDRHAKTNAYEFFPVTDDILKLATQLVYRHPLFAYDAVQLATAIDYLRNRNASATQFCFVTADKQLQRAAESEGLQTENPNDYP